MSQPDEFKQLALKRGIDMLFGGRCFSISDLRDIGKMLNVNIEQSNRYPQLRAYHCVDYSDMSSREKELLMQACAEVLRGDAILNPARMLSAVTDEGNDFAFTEDREVPMLKRL